MICFGRGVDCGLCFVGWCLFLVGAEGRVRGVNCECVTEPPCSLATGVGEAGAAAFAHALEKNTTLQELDLGGEFVVL